MLSAILRGVCPRCRKGKIFQGWMKMNERCPECRLHLDREPGYFTGAMVFSYALALVYYFTMYALLHRFTHQSLHVILVEAFLLYVPLVPLAFRLSRILWIYLDQALDPEK